MFGSHLFPGIVNSGWSTDKCLHHWHWSQLFPDQGTFLHWLQRPWNALFDMCSFTPSEKNPSHQLKTLSFQFSCCAPWHFPQNFSSLLARPLSSWRVNHHSRRPSIIRCLGGFEGGWTWRLESKTRGHLNVNLEWEGHGLSAVAGVKRCGAVGGWMHGDVVSLFWWGTVAEDSNVMAFSMFWRFRPGCEGLASFGDPVTPYNPWIKTNG